MGCARVSARVHLETGASVRPCRLVMASLSGRIDTLVADREQLPPGSTAVDRRRPAAAHSTMPSIWRGALLVQPAAGGVLCPHTTAVRYPLRHRSHRRSTICRDARVA